MTEGVGPGPHLEALARLADLRLRQGRHEEAEALTAGFDDSVTTALPAAAVRLARSEPAVAAAILERHIRRNGDEHVETAAALALLVEAHLALADVDAAAETSIRLEEVAERHNRDHPRALAAVAGAHVAAVRGRKEDATGMLERALGQFGSLGLPLESARVRLELGFAHAESRPEVAVAEAQSALAVFEELGADADADAAASLLRSLGAAGRSGPKRLGLLTKREQEVLRLVGLGLSNPEIAQRLFISRKTAAHHVSNLLAKLGLRNRAEAVAFAARTLGHPAAGRRP